MGRVRSVVRGALATLRRAAPPLALASALVLAPGAIPASATAATSAAASASPALRTGQEHDIPPLLDDDGRTLTVHGWNVEDKEHHGDAALSAITERQFRDLRSHGFNFARLLIFWDDLEPRRGQYSPRYLGKIERILNWAEKYDVQVLIDAHQDVFGPAFGHRGIPAWATRTDGLPFTPHPDDWFAEYYEPAVQRAFTHLYADPDLQRAQGRMWRLLADRFGGHPAVFGYDLINEPMGELRKGEELPTAARRIEAQQITPMYNRLTRYIRAVDRDSRLFIEPTPIVGEGVPTGLGTVRDRHVVYAPHFYNAAMEAGADYDPKAGWIESYEAAVTRYPRRQRIPVVVGEWGPLNNGLPNMNRFYRDALASLARYSSGWAGYVWCYGGGYCAADREGRLRTNKELTAAPYAAAVAGRARSQVHDPGRGRYRLVYDAHPGGRTEISLPPAARFRMVAVSGGAWSDTRAVPPGRPAVVTVRSPRRTRVIVTVSTAGDGHFVRPAGGLLPDRDAPAALAREGVARVVRVAVVVVRS
ncbi:glycoside hydrolase family 5 protein [Streptomyces sp. NPDC048638]|uniref:glycoside hydrolase family 5 protein n=1 Tax=Streptomyces sp. NPDC048638 TaxID=3365580 RepID=UPI00372094C4